MSDRRLLRAALEALLFVSDEPIAAVVLGQALGLERAEVDDLCEELARDYDIRGAKPLKEAVALAQSGARLSGKGTYRMAAAESGRGGTAEGQCSLPGQPAGGQGSGLQRADGGSAGGDAAGVY